MKRFSFLVVLLLAVFVVLLTYSASPLLGEHIYGWTLHGWPYAWAKTVDLGWIPFLPGGLEVATFQFIFEGFLIDAGFFFGVFWLLTVFIIRKKTASPHT